MLNPGARLPTAVVSVLAAATMALTPSYAADPTWKMQSAFSLTVGQTAIVYAVRGKECTDEAPSYDSIRGQLPSTTLGSFTDGGTVQRESGRWWMHSLYRGNYHYITYIATGEGWLYLAAVLDLCSRRVVGWSVEDHLRAELPCQALEMAERGKFDLVITDVNMPNMDGITLVRELRGLATYKFVPLLVLTTEATAERKQAGKAAGATGWLVKPFNPEKLLATIAKVLG